MNVRRTVVFFAVIFLFGALTGATPLKVKITVKVEKEGKPVAEQPLTLLIYNSTMMNLLKELDSKTDENGVAVFNYLAEGGEMFVAEVLYEDLSFYSDPVKFDGKSRDYKLKVEIQEVVKDVSLLKFSSARFVLIPSGEDNTVFVMEVVEIKNPTQKIVDPEEGLLLPVLSPLIGTVSSPRLTSEYFQYEEGKGIRLYLPVGPGEYAIPFTYAVSMSSPLTLVVPHPFDEVLVNYGEGLVVSGPRGGKRGEDELEGKKFGLLKYEQVRSDLKPLRVSENPFSKVPSEVLTWGGILLVVLAVVFLVTLFLVERNASGKTRRVLELFYIYVRGCVDGEVSEEVARKLAEELKKQCDSGLRLEELEELVRRIGEKSGR